MTGLEDNVGVVGNWMPPNPNPRAYFSAVSGINDKSPNNVPFSSTQKLNLGERIAVRAGFNAPPRLNTSHLSVPSDNLSPYLTIPPGLSPTTLLDSPVFLSNSLAQPSPTTGKFPFVPNESNNRSSTSMMFEAGDRSRDKSFQDNMNASSFTFKPVANSGSSFFLGEATKVVPRQSFPSIEVSVQSENSPQELESANVVGSNAEHSPPLDEQQPDNEGGGGVAAMSEDGYNWRKYGQKQVKGSEFPRSYYKCTYPNCQVKKKVERSHEGHITEIIYKGTHNHPKPPSRRTGFETRTDGSEQVGFQNGGDGGDPLDWSHHDNNHSTSLQAQSGTPFESSDAVDASSTFSNDEDEDDRGTHGSVSLGYAGEEDESESKRRKIEAYAAEMSGATRAIREPRVVVQTTSEVDILDDGYRWRKYGQKVVKGNPNPRSYYKCTSAGCAVRKHVERASHDLKSVITTYEGKHNHDVPAARNTSHHHHHHGGSAGPASSASGVAPQPPYVAVPRLDMPASLGLSFGTSQPGLRADLGMAGLGGASGVPYLTRAAKSEPDTMALANASAASWSAVYQQMIGRLPLGPHM